MKHTKRYVKMIIIILVLILIDQAIKFVIPKDELIILPGILKITYSQNTGGAFSIGSNSLPAIIIINFIILSFAIRFLIKNYDKANKMSKSALYLIISGGISNLINRIFLGYVIDYINVNDFIKFPIFNIADIFIVIRMDYFYCNYDCIYYKIKKIRRIYERYYYNIGCTD